MVISLAVISLLVISLAVCRQGEVDDARHCLVDQPRGLVPIEDPAFEQHTTLGRRQPGGQRRRWDDMPGQLRQIDARLAARTLTGTPTLGTNSRPARTASCEATAAASRATAAARTPGRTGLTPHVEAAAAGDAGSAGVLASAPPVVADTP